MYLGIVSDEVSTDFGSVLAFLRENELRFVELRLIENVNVVELPETQLHALREQLNRAGVTVEAIASPLFKCFLNPAAGAVRPEIAHDPFRSRAESWDDQMALMERTLKAAGILGAKWIRCFAFYADGRSFEEVFDEVVNRLRQAGAIFASLVADVGVHLCVENEPSTFVRTSGELARLMAGLQPGAGARSAPQDAPASGDAAGPYRALWDPGNAWCAGETELMAGFDRLRPWVGYIHLKDVSSEPGQKGGHRFVTLGEGRLQYAAQLRHWHAGGFRGYLSLEPHLIVGHGEPEGCARSVRVVRRWLEALHSGAEPADAGGTHATASAAPANPGGTPVRSACATATPGEARPDPVGIALIGSGAIAATHARAIQSLPEARLVGVWGGSGAGSFAQRFGCRLYQSLEELLDDPEVVAVDLCTPSGARLEAAVAAAGAGKHVLVEKPIEVTLERADAMVEACERAGVQLGVIFQSRFMPVYRFVHEWMQQNRLGRMVMGSATVKWHRPQSYYDTGKWKGTWALDGGGALINQAIHMVDLLRWYMGEVAEVRAFAARRARRMEAEDTLVAAIRFASGALGVIEAATSLHRGFPRRLELHGERGSVVIVDDRIVEVHLDDLTPHEKGRLDELESGASDRTFQDPAISDIRWHRAQIADFIDSVRTGRRPQVDGREGRKALQLVRAIYEAARAPEELR